MNKVKKTSDEIKIFESYAIAKNVLSGIELSWEIKLSPLGGRGIFAKRKISSGELLFVDPPLVLGPRNNFTPICVGCHSHDRLRGCSKGCGLPVCSSQCEESEIHYSECKFLSRIYESNNNNNNGSWNPHFYLCLTPIRCLFLSESDQKILLSLERHQCSQHDILIQSVNNHLKEKFKLNELQILQQGLEVLDAVAFETVNPKNSTSLRGIYPLSALMNHNCTPNTRHCFDSNNNMFIEAVKCIQAGEEITTTYTCLTWGNQARKHHLLKTKHFQCDCKRCKDPEEFGGQLMALYCLKESCNGVLLPKDSENRKWSCKKCKTCISEQKMGMIQKALGTFMSATNIKDPKRISNALRKQCLVPNSNQIAVDLKIHLVRYYRNGNANGCKSLTNDELILKELLCRDLLMLLAVLRLGECRLKGFLLLELYLILTEKTKRSKDGIILNTSGLEKFKAELGNCDLLLQATSILRYDYSAQRLLGECTKATVNHLCE